MACFGFGSPKTSSVPATPAKTAVAKSTAIPDDDPHRMVLDAEAQRRHDYTQEVQPAILRMDEYRARLNTVVQRAGIKLRVPQTHNLLGMENPPDAAADPDNHRS